MLLTFWKVKHCKGGRGGGSTVGGPKAATSTSNSKNSGSSKPQQEHKQQESSNRIRSSTNSTNNNPEKGEGQEVWVPKVGAERRPVGFRLCSRLFFLDTSKICNNWSLTFSEVLWGHINCKIVLDILQKPPGFHTTAREPKRAQLAPTLSTQPKFHEKTPRERKRAKIVAGEGKKERNFGRSGGGGSRRGRRRESVGGARQILDAPAKILNTHRTDTPQHNTTQHNTTHRVVLGKEGPSQGSPWSPKTRHEQQIVPKSSPIGQGFLGVKDGSQRFGHKTV